MRDLVINAKLTAPQFPSISHGLNKNGFIHVEYRLLNTPVVFRMYSSDGYVIMCTDIRVTLRASDIYQNDTMWVPITLYYMMYIFYDRGISIKMRMYATIKLYLKA